MEDFKESCRKLQKSCFEGEIIMAKKSLWMLGILCLLVGIIHGLRMAPVTHGVMIGCGNGNGSGCGDGNGNANGSDCQAGTEKLEKEKDRCGCRKACKKGKEKRQK